MDLLYGKLQHFILVVSCEPLFHFLKQLDLCRIPRRIIKSVEAPLDVEFFVFKEAGELGELIVGDEPYARTGIFNLKLLHGFFSSNNAQGLCKIVIGAVLL